MRRATLKRLAYVMPARGLLYFLYAYLLRGGLRDGRAGLSFCVMRALYQQMIVSMKYDLRARTTERGE